MLCLSACKIPSINLCDWPVESFKSRQSLPEFLQSFSRGIPDLVATKVDLSKLFEHSRLEEGLTLPDVDQALLSVVKRFAKNPRIKVLGLPSFSFPEEMDRACASLVQTPTCRLEDVTVRCYGVPREEATLKAPLLLEALNSNASSTIRNMEFQTSAIFLGSDSKYNAKWDEDLLANVKSILLLNKSGRRYLEDDPTNIRNGLGVIEKVKEDGTRYSFTSARTRSSFNNPMTRQGSVRSEQEE